MKLSFGATLLKDGKKKVCMIIDNYIVNYIRLEKKL